MNRPAIIFFSIFILSACSETAPPTNDPVEVTVASEQADRLESRASGPCTDTSHGTRALTTHCGFRNPEDIVPVMDGRQLIISEMGEFMMDSPGRLVVFDIEKRTTVALPLNLAAPATNWADATCPPPEPELFSPHGIDLMTRADGQHQLLVVNHGGRESVEFFNLVQSGDGWQAEWRGCAVPPEDPFINDVSGLADGGFLVTHMWNKSTPFEEVAALLTSGTPTGWVWLWQPGNGFTRLPGSREMMPNGIAVSKNNQFAFVNIYMGNKTIKIDLNKGELVGEFAVQQPDNISLDTAGNLWIASHLHNPIDETCTGVETGACLLPFQIIKANPDTLETEIFLKHQGEPMGYTTVATRVGDVIYMGSAHGDRIATVGIE